MIVFTNPGELELTFIKTFGLSVKEGKTPFGRFGTGLKYGIAGVLRLGGSITITVGEARYGFEARETQVRGKTTKLVYMTGPARAEALPFTTELGAHWAPWMVLREFYCNWRDEGGEVGAEPGTRVEIDCPSLDAVEWDEHFLPEGWKPLATFPGLEVYRGPCDALFYQGVMVTTESQFCQYTYNLVGELDLTEDRTATTWDTRSAIMKAIAQGGEEQLDIIASILLGTDAEASWDWDIWSIEASPTVKEFLKLNYRNKNLVKSARSYAARKWRDELNFVPTALNPQEEAMRAAVVDAGKRLGLGVLRMLKTEELGEDAEWFGEVIFVGSPGWKDEITLFALVIGKVRERKEWEEREYFIEKLLWKALGEEGGEGEAP